MQASAPEVDLFGTPVATRATCVLTLTGILSRADVAQKPTGDGHFVPTLVLELDGVGAGHHHIVAHIPYLPGEEAKATARAKQLRRGHPVTVTTELTDMRVLLPAASLVPHDKP